jgi:hypothetical protein
MAISYPLALPGSPNIKRITFTMKTAIAMSESPFTYQQQVYKNAGEQWMARIELPPMTRPQAELWISFLLKLDGRYGTFYLGDPDAEDPLGTGNGTPLIDGSAQTGNEITTDGWASSENTVLAAGDYIQIGDYMYKVLDNVNTSASGSATLLIKPSLRSSPADNATIIIRNAKSKFRLLNNEITWTTDSLMLYGLTFDCIEAI